VRINSAASLVPITHRQDGLPSKRRREIAAANLRNYEAEAEGQKRSNEARNSLSPALIDFDLTKERLHTIPQALSETVRPLEKIGDVKIIDLGGGLSGRASGGGNGIASGPAGGPMDGLLGSLLAYRANAPVIDKLLAEAGFDGGSNPLQALVSATHSSPAHAELPALAKPEQLQAEIHAALQEWTEALGNDHDEKPVTALYDRDATLLATLDPKPLETPAEIVGYFHKLTQNPELKATVQSDKMYLFGDAAVASGLYTFSYRKDGQLVELPARYTFRLPQDTTRLGHRPPPLLGAARSALRRSPPPGWGRDWEGVNPAAARSKRRYETRRSTHPHPDPPPSRGREIGLTGSAGGR
jgi:hypothetical protein